MAYYTVLIEKKKSNHRFLFRSVARVIQTQSSVEPHIPISLASNDFMTFFNTKFDLLERKFRHHYPQLAWTFSEHRDHGDNWGIHHDTPRQSYLES